MEHADRTRPRRRSRRQCAGAEAVEAARAARLRHKTIRSTRAPSGMAHAPGLHPRHATATSTVSVNVLPCPGLLVTVRSPFIALASRFTSTRPRPVLRQSGARHPRSACAKGRNNFLISAGVTRCRYRSPQSELPQCRLRGVGFAVTAKCDLPATRGEFHGIVDEIFQRRPQAHGIALRSIRDVIRNRQHSPTDPPMSARAASDAATACGQLPRRKDLPAQDKARSHPAFTRIQHQSRSTATDARGTLNRPGPAKLAFRQIGCCEQFGQGQHAY